MEELDDKIYKFVIVGRIIFMTTCLITAILLTVTAVKAANPARTATVEDPDMSFTAKEDKDDVEVPVAGDVSDDSSDESEKPEEKPEEKPTELTSNQQPEQAAVQPVNVASHSEPTPIPSKPARPAFDYDKVYYVDDNTPGTGSIPVVPGDTDDPGSDAGGNTEPVEAINSDE